MYEDLVLAMIKEGYHPGGKKHVSPNSPAQVVNFLAHLCIQLEKNLQRAIKEESFEEAAQIRDEIKFLKGEK
jgi:protein-arginine kinase activator protein McsA